jgi:antirestriction protein ArdC
MEELRAELSSAFLSGEIGIPADIPQHASYIAEWLKPLRSDKRRSSEPPPMPSGSRI